MTKLSMFCAILICRCKKKQLFDCTNGPVSQALDQFNEMVNNSNCQSRVYIICNATLVVMRSLFTPVVGLH